MICFHVGMQQPVIFGLSARLVTRHSKREGGMKLLCNSLHGVVGSCRSFLHAWHWHHDRDEDGGTAVLLVSGSNIQVKRI